MKRIVSVLLAVVMVGSAVSNAHAIGAYMSWWKPDKIDDQGFGAGLRMPIKIIPILSVDARASWINFSDNDMNVYPVEAIGIVTLGIFYGGLGLGYYFFDSSNDAYEVKDSVGWNVVLGATLGLQKLNIFGEAKWTDLEADVEALGTNVSPPNSLDAAGVGFNLGLMFGL